MALAAVLFCASACQTNSASESRKSEPIGQKFSALERRVLDRPMSAAGLSRSGPWRVEAHLNYRIPLSPTDSVLSDAFVPNVKGQSPLVVFVHGNHSSKKAHRGQAQHLASWGFHTLAIQLPKKAQWPKNGERLATLVRMIAQSPSLIAASVDPKRILVAGHSFGGSAATIAVSEGAPISGLILLDPAVVSRRVERAMTEVDVPVVILGADRTVFRARRRTLFFGRIDSEVGELSVRGATHDDAQFPSMFSMSTLGVDPYTSASHQRLFVAAITASAMSIAITGGLEFAWESLADAERSGKIVNMRRKGMPDPEIAQ